MKILSVVAARPNFVKIAPFIRVIQDFNVQNSEKIEHILVHTGQHYDTKMSESFFSEFEISKPNYNLEIGSGSFAEQDGKTMVAFEQVLTKEKPNWVVVVGDVNATMACTIIAKKMNYKVCHIEAGIRSKDKSMPEEINRLITDSIADLLLTPDEISVNNLVKEGRSSNEISFVGNIMIDTLDFCLEKIKKLSLLEIITKNLFQKNRSNSVSFDSKFCLITLHRPSNVDSKEKLQNFISCIKNKVSDKKDIIYIWVLHPRTLKNVEKFNLLNDVLFLSECILLNPLSYSELLFLNFKAQFIVTDSGGLQEEACVLGTPFFVMRENTERENTLKINGGTGVLIGNSIEKLNSEIENLLSTANFEKKLPFRPQKWDGKSANRCLEAILKHNC